MRKKITPDKIIYSFLISAFDKSAGATSLSDIADSLGIKKASLYNHFASREEMYDATVDYCAKELLSVNFLSDKIIDSVKNSRNSFISTVKKLILRYFNLIESDPLFQMYVFVHTEQYFNKKAFETVNLIQKKICEDIKKLLDAASEVQKINVQNEKEIREISKSLMMIVCNGLDSYIAEKKETVRKNPESGAGSLFALPANDSATTEINKTIEILLSKI